MTTIELLKKNLQAAIAAKQQFLEDAEQHEIFRRAVDVLIRAYKEGGRLYIAGNGGSAADAQHLATEFVSKLARPRAPLPAEALTTDTSTITAIGNDFGFDEVFARQVVGKMTRRDVFLGITTSGQSRNILRALEECRRMEVPTIVLSGSGGGKVKEMADYCIVATGQGASGTQEVHTVLYHTLCGCVEEAMFPI